MHKDDQVELVRGRELEQSTEGNTRDKLTEEGAKTESWRNF